MSDELAPVTELFGASRKSDARQPAGHPAGEPGAGSKSAARTTARAAAVDGGPRLVSIPGGQGDTQAHTAAVPAGMDDEDREPLVAEGQEMLVRALARSDRSVEEARRLLRDWRSDAAATTSAPDEGSDDALAFEEALRLDETEVERIVGRCLELGYLDDLRLAELLVHKTRERKRAGAHGVERVLRERRIDDDIIKTVMAERDQDDELEAARELATERARRTTGLEPDAAIRRLVGFLSRRGYSASTAFTAARDAVHGASGPRRSPGSDSGVAFGPTPVE